MAKRNLAGSVSKRDADGATVRRRADGSVCRARKSSASASLTSEAAPTSSAVPTSAAVTTSEVAVTWTDTSVVAVTTSEPASPPSTSSAAPSETTAASSGPIYTGGGSGWANTGSKLGAAWPNGDWALPGDANYIANYIGSKTSWYYTWCPTPVASADALGLEFVPMLWDPGHITDWYAQQPFWPNTVKNALFFNEPNIHSQANYAAEESVSYWMNDMVPLRSRGIALGGAAPTNAPSGIQWVKDALAACVGAGNSKADCTPE